MIEIGQSDTSSKNAPTEYYTNMRSRWKFVMHIAFDNSRRLKRRIYYFTYKDIKFKLIQNNLKWRDVLLSIISHDNEQEKGRVFDVASEFLSALAWEHNAHITMGYIGGYANGGIKNLKQVRCCNYTPRYIPKIYYAKGFNLNRIAYIENDNQKIALTLFREAFSSLNPYLSFLFYWHIIEIGQPSRVEWINDVFASNKVYIRDYSLEKLQLGKKSIGEYFQDDCRNAIAHIKRPGKKTLKLDSYSETERIDISSRIIGEFAKYHIRETLGLQKSLFLVRCEGTKFPEFLDEDKLKNEYRYRMAY